MIGQEKLLNKIKALTLDVFPHTILIEGTKGSGRHTLVNVIKEHLNIDLIDLKELGVNDDTINYLTLSPTPRLCLLDLTGVSIKEQNVLLKFIEEPLEHCYIILLCEDYAQVISTIANRCQVWKLEPYTKEQLKIFYDKFTQYEEYPYTNEKIFDIADTPGDLVELKLNTEVDKVLDLIDNILCNIGNANFSNVLVLVDKIYDFNTDKGIVNFEMFIKMFMYVLRKYIIKNDIFDMNKLYNVYFRLEELYIYYKQFYLHLNNKYLYETFLLDLKLLMK